MHFNFRLATASSIRRGFYVIALFILYTKQNGVHFQYGLDPDRFSNRIDVFLRRLSRQNPAHYANQ